MKPIIGIFARNLQGKGRLWAAQVPVEKATSAKYFHSLSLLASFIWWLINIPVPGVPVGWPLTPSDKYS